MAEGSGKSYRRSNISAPSAAISESPTSRPSLGKMDFLKSVDSIISAAVKGKSSGFSKTSAAQENSCTDVSKSTCTTSSARQRIAHQAARTPDLKRSIQGQDVKPRQNLPGKGKTKVKHAANLGRNESAPCDLSRGAPLYSDMPKRSYSGVRNDATTSPAKQDLVKSSEFEKELEVMDEIKRPKRIKRTRISSDSEESLNDTEKGEEMACPPGGDIPDHSIHGKLASQKDLKKSSGSDSVVSGVIECQLNENTSLNIGICAASRGKGDQSGPDSKERRSSATTASDDSRQVESAQKEQDFEDPATGPQTVNSITSEVMEVRNTRKRTGGLQNVKLVEDTGSKSRVVSGIEADKNENLTVHDSGKVTALQVRAECDKIRAAPVSQIDKKKPDQIVTAGEIQLSQSPMPSNKRSDVEVETVGEMKETKKTKRTRKSLDSQEPTNGVCKGGTKSLRKGGRIASAGSPGNNLPQRASKKLSSIGSLIRDIIKSDPPDRTCTDNGDITDVSLKVDTKQRKSIAGSSKISPKATDVHGVESVKPGLVSKTSLPEKTVNTETEARAVCVMTRETVETRTSLSSNETSQQGQQREVIEGEKSDMLGTAATEAVSLPAHSLPDTEAETECCKTIETECTVGCGTELLKTMRSRRVNGPKRSLSRSTDEKVGEALGKDDVGHGKGAGAHEKDDGAHGKDDGAHVKDDGAHGKDDGAHEKDDGGRRKDDGGRGKDDGAHEKDDGAHGKDDGAHEKDDGGRRKDDGGRGKDDGAHEKDDGAHGKDDGAHGKNDGAHGKDDGAHGKNDGAHEKDDVGRGKDDGAHGKDDGAHEKDDGGRGKDDGAHEKDDGAHGKDDGAHVKGDGAHEKDDGAHEKDDGAHGKDDGAHENDDGAHGKDDGAHGKDDGAHEKDDGAHGKDDEAHGKDDGAHGKDDGAHGKDDGEHGKDDGGRGKDGEAHEKDDGAHEKDDGAHEKDDGAHGKDDGAHENDDGAHGKDDGAHRKDDGAHEKDDGAHGKDDEAHGKDDGAHGKDDGAHGKDDGEHEKNDGGRGKDGEAHGKDDGAYGESVSEGKLHEEPLSTNLPNARGRRRCRKNSVKAAAPKVNDFISGENGEDAEGGGEARGDFEAAKSIAFRSCGPGRPKRKSTDLKFSESKENEEKGARYEGEMTENKNGGKISPLITPKSRGRGRPRKNCMELKSSEPKGFDVNSDGKSVDDSIQMKKNKGICYTRSLETPKSRPPGRPRRKSAEPKRTELEIMDVDKVIVNDASERKQNKDNCDIKSSDTSKSRGRRRSKKIAEDSKLPDLRDRTGNKGGESVDGVRGVDQNKGEGETKPWKTPKSPGSVEVREKSTESVPDNSKTASADPDVNQEKRKPERSRSKANVDEEEAGSKMANAVLSTRASRSLSRSRCNAVHNASEKTNRAREKAKTDNAKIVDESKKTEELKDNRLKKARKRTLDSKSCEQAMTGVSAEKKPRRRIAEKGAKDATHHSKAPPDTSKKKTRRSVGSRAAEPVKSACEGEIDDSQLGSDRGDADGTIPAENRAADQAEDGDENEKVVNEGLEGEELVRKVFTCKACEKRYFNAVSVRHHERSVHGIYLYNCGASNQKRCKVRKKTRTGDDTNAEAGAETASKAAGGQLAAGKTTPGGRVRRKAAIKAADRWQESAREMADIGRVGRHFDVITTKYLLPGTRKPVIGAFWASSKHRLGAGSSVSCPFDGCSADFWSYNKLKDHMANCPDGLETDVFKCVKCGHTAKREWVMKKHVRTHKWAVNGGLSDDDLSDDPTLDFDPGKSSSESSAEEEEESGVEETEDESSEEEEEEEEVEEVEEELDGCRASSGGSRRASGVRPTSGMIIPSYYGAYAEALSKTMMKLKENQNIVPRPAKFLPCIHEKPYQWMLGWLTRESRQDLFSHWRPQCQQWQLLNQREALEYLPLEGESIAINYKSRKKKEENELHTVRLFESVQRKGSTTVFVGGPIISLAWCPVPVQVAMETEQYLAVYSHQTAETEYPLEQSQNGKTLIQFWNFGLNKEARPQLVFCLALEVGAVCEMQWCPTGAFSLDHPADRLGLLALACSSGNIYILSIPKPSWLLTSVDSNTSTVPVFRTSPLVTLMSTIQGQAKFNCLCMDWAWKQNCSQIIGGFGDGSVCLWDLTTTSPLLRQQDAGTGELTISPFRAFRAHLVAVRGVRFCQQNPRFFASISGDRSTRLWDVELGDMCYDEYQRHYGRCLAWPLFYPLHFTGSDDCYAWGTNAVYLVDSGYLEKKSAPILVTRSCCQAMTFSPWLNTLVVAMSSGELQFMYFPHLLHVGKNLKTPSNSRMLMSFAQVEADSSVMENTSVTQPPQGTGSENSENTEAVRESTRENSPHDLPSDSTMSRTSNGGGNHQKVTCTCCPSVNGLHSSNVDGVGCDRNCRNVNEKSVLESSQEPVCDGTGSQPESSTSTRRPKYCVAIKDSKLESLKHLGTCMTCKMVPDSAMDSQLTTNYSSSINAVSWNPNVAHTTWLAAGSAPGLLRVFHVDALHTPNMANWTRSFLKEHATS